MKLRDLSESELEVIRDLYLEAMSETVDDEAMDVLMQMLDYYDIPFDDIVKEFED